MNRKSLMGMGLITATLMACSDKGDKFKTISLEYPETKKINHIDEYCWTEVIGETEDVLETSTAGGKIFASYLRDAITEVRQFNLM